MSIRSGIQRISVQEVLVLALILLFVFAVVYSEIELTYKIAIAALVFAIIFLTGMADQVLKQEKEKRQF
ncbi:MAG: hypothetical protein QXU99_06395 [Candidatus Bathyarchaeia archaeon]